MTHTRNRMANSYNKYQTEVKKVLCVCSAGLLRSPTAANVLHQEFGYNTRAAGITHEYALVPVDAVLLEWADEIVCVEPDVMEQVVEFATNNSNEFDSTLSELLEKIKTLHVPDRYNWNAPELRQIILDQYLESIPPSERK